MKLLAAPLFLSIVIALALSVSQAAAADRPPRGLRASGAAAATTTAKKTKKANVANAAAANRRQQRHGDEEEEQPYPHPRRHLEKKGEKKRRLKKGGGGGGGGGKAKVAKQQKGGKTTTNTKAKATGGGGGNNNRAETGVADGDWMFNRMGSASGLNLPGVEYGTIVFSTNPSGQCKTSADCEDQSCCMAVPFSPSTGKCCLIINKGLSPLMLQQCIKPPSLSEEIIPV
eukprot:CAMPEP_0113553150 /NCGR_PEP_ID=MMETSP0015_2-20120614/15454_1 /TAXON_ID=2838 /ORGANISM="Odontella" /LENGTH=228 /DNA_ID=CAMNT_0000454189 /DNA_START=29 /DNA_END=715 /DNA_ORIENTATION=- /assembly_acc=CAM_ASM_000160